MSKEKKQELIDQTITLPSKVDSNCSLTELAEEMVKRISVLSAGDKESEYTAEVQERGVIHDLTKGTSEITGRKIRIKKTPLK